MIEPTLLKAARQTYLRYCETHPHTARQPTGVAINVSTYQGTLIFAEKPVLLPDECFVPLSQIESEI